MSETFICDKCDRRISEGYTVAWCNSLEESTAGIHFAVSSKDCKNLCNDCWPRNESIIAMTKRIIGMDQ